MAPSGVGLKHWSGEGGDKLMSARMTVCLCVWGGGGGLGNDGWPRCQHDKQKDPPWRR